MRAEAFSCAEVSSARYTSRAEEEGRVVKRGPGWVAEVREVDRESEAS